MRFKEAAVGIHRLACRGEPRQHVILQRAVSLDGVKQSLDRLEPLQHRLEQGPVQQMNASAPGSRPNDEVISDHILRSLRRSLECQRPQRHRLALHLALGKAGLQRGLYAVDTFLSQAVLTFEFQFQRQHRQLHP